MNEPTRKDYAAWEKIALVVFAACNHRDHHPGTMDMTTWSVPSTI